MKRSCLFLPLLFLAKISLACQACEKQQPKLTRGLTHGAGPDSQWDYVIVFTTIIVVLVTLFLSVKWLIRPNESASGHIKTSILNQ